VVADSITGRILNYCRVVAVSLVLIVLSIRFLFTVAVAHLEVQAPV
jgi:hypothetical protein